MHTHTHTPLSPYLCYQATELPMSFNLSLTCAHLHSNTRCLHCERCLNVLGNVFKWPKCAHHIRFITDSREEEVKERVLDLRAGRMCGSRSQPASPASHRVGMTHHTHTHKPTMIDSLNYFTPTWELHVTLPPLYSVCGVYVCVCVCVCVCV